MFSSRSAAISDDAVDPAVAGPMLAAAINVASDVRMLHMATEDRLERDYARPLFNGLLRP